jgi:hypothetical protein
LETSPQYGSYFDAYQKRDTYHISPNPHIGAPQSLFEHHCDSRKPCALIPNFDHCTQFKCTTIMSFTNIQKKKKEKQDQNPNKLPHRLLLIGSPSFIIWIHNMFIQYLTVNIATCNQSHPHHTIHYVATFMSLETKATKCITTHLSAALLLSTDIAENACGMS